MAVVETMDGRPRSDYEHREGALHTRRIENQLTIVRSLKAIYQSKGLALGKGCAYLHF